jgi:hypothetical protein
MKGRVEGAGTTMHLERERGLYGKADVQLAWRANLKPENGQSFYGVA